MKSSQRNADLRTLAYGYLTEYSMKMKEMLSSHLYEMEMFKWPFSDKTQIRTAQDIADDLSVFLNNTYILLRISYCCKIECEVTMLSQR